MKLTYTRRILAMVLSVLLIAALTGCAEVSGSVSGTETPKAADTPTSEPTAETALPAEPEPFKPALYVIGVNAAVQQEGEWRVLRLDEAAEINIVPVVPDGMTFDHWEVDGIATEGDENGLTLNVFGTTVVEAVLRPLKKVVSVNASMQLVNEKLKSKGDSFTDFMFEYDYQAIDGIEAGGSISLSVEAEIPDYKAMDYWIINGVPYFFGGNITGFAVKGLDSATVYEAVLRDKDTEPTIPSSIPTVAAAPVLPSTPDGNVSESVGYEQYVVGVNCTLNGKDRLLTLDSETEITANAAPESDQVIDHWEIEGILVEGATGNTLTFTAEKTTAVRAVMRKLNTVKTESAYMQFIDVNGKPDGERFRELMFDGEYKALGVVIPAGTATVQVRAETPDGKAVLGWRINGVEYYPNERTDRFVVQNLDTATVYEPLFYTLATPKPTQTLTPTQQPHQDNYNPPSQPEPPAQTEPPFDPGGGYVGGGTIPD